MEPVAPGTEDDPPIDFASLTKQETEHERLLKQKAILKNGQYENIFELSYVNGAEHWFCKVCQCPVMGRVYQHELGRRHNVNLHMTNRHLEKKSPEPDQDNMDSPIEIAPGEPAPPGFESEINRQAQIQDRLDGFKVGPLVALEYLVEMIDYDATKEPLYLCILCDKRGDPRTVLTHLASYNHISQYLQKHFPTCYRALAPYMTKQYKRNWQSVLQKIAEAIEKKFGRLRPFSLEKDKFEKDRIQYLTMICKGRHFSEQTGHTFQELVVHDELTRMYDDDKGDLAYTSSTTNNWGGKTFIEKPFQKRSPSPPVVAHPSKKVKPQLSPPNKLSPSNNKPPAKTKPLAAVTTAAEVAVKKRRSFRADPIPGTRRRSLSSVSSASSSDLSDSEAKAKRRSGVRRRSPVRRYDDDRRLPYNRDRRRSPSPRRRTYEKPNYYNNKPKETSQDQQKEKEKIKLEKLQEYKKLAKAIENDMEKTLKNHEKNPEKHPKYNDEWKLFWNKRYKELQGEGKDVTNHDFKPEWIGFWGKRMLEIHEEEVKNRKESLRKRLGLVEEPTPISFRIGNLGSKPATKSSPTEGKPNLPMAAQPDNDPEVIVIDDKEDDAKSGKRSHSPWEEESPPTRRVTTPVRTVDKIIIPFAKKTSPKDTAGAKPTTAEKRPSPKGRTVATRERSTRRSRSRDRRSRSRESRTRDRRSRSFDRIPRRSRELSYDKYSRARRSRSRDNRRDVGYYPRDGDRDVRSRSRERERRVTPTRDRSERPRMRREYRESSYERDLRRDRIRTVADLPWEREKVFRPDYDDRFYVPPPGMMRDVSRQPVILPPPIMPEEDDDNEEVNIVSVLRLLTALEERLGSLGPKIIDLLAQALALEKKEANSSETLLDNEINCVMFETVKEKLKGQLLAGFVDMVQERAFKRAIKKTASLIHIASERRREREHLHPKGGPVSVPGVGAVDKGAIAKQIANALVAQGKTDVTQAELEQLINAVVGMAEASKNSGKPITTASFLDQLSGVSKPPSAPVEKIIIPTKVKEEEKKKPELIDLNLEPLSPEESPDRSTSFINNMENLSDSDLQTLLQNFKDLSTDEQMNLIDYLKKLEVYEPERVERLRKFVNLGKTEKDEEKDDKNEEDEKEKPKPDRGSRESPFSNRMAGLNPTGDDNEENGDDKKREKLPEKIIRLDSEDEDYTYEDVVKAVSTQVKNKEMADNQKLVEDSIEFNSKRDVNLSDAKALISNLMSNITKKSSGIDLLGLSSSGQTSSGINTVTSSADFSKTLSSINVASLASIMSNVQSKTSVTQSPNKLKFEPPSFKEPDESFEKPERINQGPSRVSPGPINLRLGGSMGPGPGNMGPGPRNIGLSLGNMGPGPGIARPGPGNMGPGPRNNGPESGGMGLGPGNMRTGPGNMGPGPGNMGPGSGNMGPGPGNMGPVPGLMGSGPGNMGPGPGNMGPGLMRSGLGNMDSRVGNTLLGPGPMRPSGGSMGLGSGFGGPGPNNYNPRLDRPAVQYPTRGPNPYGSQFGNSNFPSQQNVSYPNLRAPRPPFISQGFGGNPRFGGPGNRPGGNFNNRW